jgi:hypothetical protein
MALQETNLLITASSLPAEFRGSPQQMYAALVARLKIMSPVGIVNIVVSDTEPTSNQGLWLKGGTKPYVFDINTARYIPMDLSDSVDALFQIGDNVPDNTNPPIWLKTKGGRAIGWFFFDGTFWKRDASVVFAAPTVSRPTDPEALEQMYDSDIATLIWYERGEWRTVSGSPGDVKFVVHDTLEEALRYNPGWEVVGANQTSWRGRLISQATKDAGSSPTTVLGVPAGVAERAAHEIYGETDGVAIDGSSPVPYPPTIAMWTLYKK